MINGEAGRNAAEKRTETLITAVQKKNDRQQIVREVYEKFNIPPDLTSDILSFKKDVRELTNFELFAILSFLKKEDLPKYFTKEEIAGFSGEREEEQKATFPLELKVQQVTESQWIGACSMRTLMELRNSQMINYRENAQRVFKIVKSGGIETLRIAINKKAIEQIKESILNGTYIPDDITLNMPEGSRYAYDDGTLTIYELPDGKFDIIDGYHRYLAMCSIYNFDKSFDYPMEIRITNFDIGTCQQMIYQKDQKTVMKKVDSNTFNQNDMGNQIANAINRDSSCNINGMIGRVNAGIDMATFAALITKFFVPKGIKRSEESLVRANIKRNLVDKINTVTDQRTEFLGKWNDRQLYVMMFLFMKDEVDLNAYDYIISKTNNEDDLFSLTRNGNGFRKRAESLVVKIYEDWRRSECGTTKLEKTNS